jgi:threonine dehydratase
MSSVSIREIQEAAVRIRPQAVVTPLVPFLYGSEGDSISLKCESFQPVGAFKIRGAMNAMRQLTFEELSNGVVTQSSGNHAQAIAYAAQELGVTAHIVMPSNSPSIKVAGVRRYNGIVYFCEPTEAARIATCEKIKEETRAVYIHPYNDDRVIAGQGTVGLEVLEQLPAIESLIVPIGGGGLISGIAIAIKSLKPTVRLIGIEPEGAADALASVNAGAITPVSGGGQSIAEGLLSTVGTRTFEIIRRHVDEIVTVSDKEIAAATLVLFERAKLVVEPSGATAFAALLSRKCLASGPDTVVVLTGGNVDTRRFPELRNLAGLEENV